ncbi:MAG: hypothetical protein ACI4GC_07640 [Acutalibacteraceae bacterium]
MEYCVMKLHFVQTESSRVEYLDRNVTGESYLEGNFTPLAEYLGTNITGKSYIEINFTPLVEYLGRNITG